MSSTGVVASAPSGMYYMTSEEITKYRSLTRFIGIRRVAEIMRVNKIPVELAAAILSRTPVIKY